MLPQRGVTPGAEALPGVGVARRLVEFGVAEEAAIPDRLRQPGLRDAPARGAPRLQPAALEAGEREARVLRLVRGGEAEDPRGQVQGRTEPAAQLQLAQQRTVPRKGQA